MFCSIIKGECKKDCVFRVGDHCMISDCLIALFLKISDERETALITKDTAKKFHHVLNQLTNMAFGDLKNMPPEVREVIEKAGGLSPELKKQVEDILKGDKDENEHKK